MASKINHISHGMAATLSGPAAHGGKPNIARDGLAKKVHGVEVNAGMRATPKSGGDALSGHEASALDAMSGATVTGPVKSTPGWGNATARSGNPFATPPGAKRLTPPRPSWDCKDGDGNDCGDLADLGRAVLAEAAAGHRGGK